MGRAKGNVYKGQTKGKLLDGPYKRKTSTRDRLTENVYMGRAKGNVFKGQTKGKLLDGPY